MNVDVQYKMYFEHTPFGVELFFLCSVFFLAKSAFSKMTEKRGMVCEPEDMTWRYIIHKSKSI